MRTATTFIFPNDYRRTFLLRSPNPGFLSLHLDRRRQTSIQAHSHPTMSPSQSLIVYTTITSALISISTQAPAQPHNTTTISPNPNALTLPSILNTTTPPTNHSLLKSTYECIPNFAPGLLPTSCQNLIPNSLLDAEDDTPKTWGPRGLGPGYTYDFPAPQRIISCKITIHFYFVHWDIWLIGGI